jgi:hypothetical protein
MEKFGAKPLGWRMGSGRFRREELWRRMILIGKRDGGEVGVGGEL